jgi:transposase
MERIPNAVYTNELREEAVKLVTEGGLSVPEVGRRLSIASSTIRYWIRASKKGVLNDVGKKRKPLTELEMELARVKRELAGVKMERDILKKAAAYFAKESLPGTWAIGAKSCFLQPRQNIRTRCKEQDLARLLV